ncbi:MAG: MmgE/PrpD family protein [Dongia sp.]
MSMIEPAMKSCSDRLSQWVAGVRFEDLPADVVENTCLRVLDVFGLVLAGSRTPFGRSVRGAVLALNPTGPGRLFGTGDATTVPGAAFANGALSQALEFDDTHNESIVHMSSPAVAAGFALAELNPVTGPDLIAAIAIGNEISCRVGSVSPGQFHRRGFHPTGLFATFGATWLAARLLGLEAAQMNNAAGIAGSFAAGLLQCWVDGTQSKFLHPGWAAQSGITAAMLGKTGTTGPAAVFEGRFGLFASHLQDESVPRSYGRITDGLGDHWESRNASFKPFPVAHVIHPYIDALLRLRAQHKIDPSAVEKIVVPVAPYIVGIVCEPLAEKRRPRSDSHGRVSMQYTLAEALVLGRIDKNAYQPESLSDPRILGIADRVEIEVDPGFPGPERFKGAVKIIMKDGSVHETVEENNRGSAANPMAVEDIVAKFDANAADVLNEAERRALGDAVLALPKAKDAARVADLTIAGGAGT